MANVHVMTPNTDNDLYLFDEYCRAHCLPTAELRDEFGITLKTFDDLEDRIHRPPNCTAVVRIGYFGLDGIPTSYYQVRYLFKRATGFLTQVDAKSIGKGRAKPGVVPETYVVPGPDWHNIPEGSVIHICESPIKAIASYLANNRQGYFIGIPGINGWGAWNKWRIPLLAGLDALPWSAAKLQARVIFDAAARYNPQASRSLSNLATILVERKGAAGCLVAFTPHPPEEDDNLKNKPNSSGGTYDCGMDDFILRVGQEAAAAWINDPESFTSPPASELDLARDEMNSEFCFVEEGNLIVDMAHGIPHAISPWKTGTVANRMARGTDDELRAVGITWLQWPHRRTTLRMSYSPGAPAYSRQVLNTWRPGPFITPSDEPPTLWLKIFEDNEVEEIDFILNCFAWIVQHPGSPIDFALFFYGNSGTGKDALLKPIEAIIGDHNFKITDKDTLESPYSGSYLPAQVLVLSELEKVGKQTLALIKNLVTAKNVVVKIKRGVEYTVENNMFLIMTSNSSAPIKMDEDDRRIFMARFMGCPKVMNGDYWAAYHDWIGCPGRQADPNSPGVRSIYSFLMQRDLTGWQPYGRVPTTQAKIDVTENSRTPQELFIHDLRTDPESMFPTATVPPVISSERLVLLAQQYGVEQTSVQSIGRAMQQARPPFRKATGTRIKLGPAIHKRSYWILDDKVYEKMEDVRAALVKAGVALEMA